LLGNYILRSRLDSLLFWSFSRWLFGDFSNFSLGSGDFFCGSFSFSFLIDYFLFFSLDFDLSIFDFLGSDLNLCFFLSNFLIGLSFLFLGFLLNLGDDFEFLSFFSFDFLNFFFLDDSSLLNLFGLKFLRGSLDFLGSSSNSLFGSFNLGFNLSGSLGSSNLSWNSIGCSSWSSLWFILT